MIELERRLVSSRLWSSGPPPSRYIQRPRQRISKRYGIKYFSLHLFIVQGGLVASVSHRSPSFPPSKVVRREGHAVFYDTALPYSLISNEDISLLD
jgi:hypothetical protein